MDDLEKAEKLWDEVTMDKLVPISKKELIKRGIGLYLGGKSPQLAMRFLSDKLDHGAISNEGAIEVLNKYIDLIKLMKTIKYVMLHVLRFQSVLLNISE